jgi:PAS domain S-box-containing protein
MIHDLLDAPPVPLSSQRVTHVPHKRRASILIVDDREDKITALESVLSSLGEHIVLARSGCDALREVLHHEFAVILMDVFMPGMDGFETAAMIRQRAQTQQTPIIFVTSVHNTDDLTARGYSLGAVDYIFSPIVPDVLRTKIAVFLDLYRKTKTLEEQVAQIRKLQRLSDGGASGLEKELEQQTHGNPFFMLSTQMLAVVDATGAYRCVNPAWEHGLGFIEDELKDKNILTVIHEHDWQHANHGLALLERSAPASFKARHRTKEGSYRRLNWTVLPFVGNDLFYVFAREVSASGEKIHLEFSRS